MVHLTHEHHDSEHTSLIIPTFISTFSTFWHYPSTSGSCWNYSSPAVTTVYTYGSFSKCWHSSSKLHYPSTWGSWWYYSSPSVTTFCTYGAFSRWWWFSKCSHSSSTLHSLLSGTCGLQSTSCAFCLLHYHHHYHLMSMNCFATYATYMIELFSPSTFMHRIH